MATRTSESGTQTGLDLVMKPAVPVRPVPAPPTAEDIAARAAVGDSMIMTELDSNDFMKSVQDFIDHVQTRAYPQLEQNIRRVEQSLAEQIDDLTMNRFPQYQLEKELAAKRAELAGAEEKLKAVVFASHPGSSAGGGERRSRGGGRRQRGGKNDGKADLEFKKWKFLQTEKKAQLEARIQRLKAEVSEKEDKLNKLGALYSRVPNESVYNNAFDALAQSVQYYVEDVRLQTDKVMRSRKDGPLLKIDRDALETVSDAVADVFKKIERSLMSLLTNVDDGNTVRLFEG